jgi:hypothetical protein
MIFFIFSIFFISFSSTDFFTSRPAKKIVEPVVARKIAVINNKILA